MTHTDMIKDICWKGWLHLKREYPYCFLDHWGQDHRGHIIHISFSCKFQEPLSWTFAHVDIEVYYN